MGSIDTRVVSSEAQFTGSDRNRKTLFRLEDVYLDFPVLAKEAFSLKRIILGQNLNVRPRIIRGLDNVNLEICAGDRVGLIGPNGSGKSTMLRVLSGIYYPTAGKITANCRTTPLLGIGVGTNMENQAFNNIRILLGADGIVPTEDEMDAIWDFAEIDPKFKFLPMRSFSSGMVMRLMFSAVTHFQPEVLLLDEWLSVVDESFAIKSQKRMRELVEKTEALILASHDYNLIRDTCDRYIRMEHGVATELSSF